MKKIISNNSNLRWEKLIYFWKNPNETEIIPVDVYTNNKAIITNYANDIQGFINKVTPTEQDIEETKEVNFSDGIDMKKVVRMINKIGQSKKKEL